MRRRQMREREMSCDARLEGQFVFFRMLAGGRQAVFLLIACQKTDRVVGGEGGARKERREEKVGGKM